MRVSNISGCLVMAVPLLFAVSCASSSYGPIYQVNPAGQGDERSWWEQEELGQPTTQLAAVPQRWATVRIPADVLFDLDSDVLGPAGREKLSDLVVAGLAQAAAIAVAGATDSSGNFEYNLELSRRRAKSAAEELQTLGIDPSIITVEAWADTRPLLDSMSGEPLGPDVQRRIEILALLPSDVAEQLEGNQVEVTS